MKPRRNMSKQDAIDLINENLGPAVVDTLLGGLPGGQFPEWGFDDELIMDIGDAVGRWKERKA